MTESPLPASPPADRPRLFLHIGMNKAGSSALQRTLAASDRLLRKHGLLYPSAGRARSQAHHLLSYVLGFSQGTPPKIKGPEELKDLDLKFLAEARKHGCNTVLVSSEVFTNRGDIERVREYFAGWDTRIVVYLRRHDTWWASCYSQGLKTMTSPPWGPGFEGYLDHQLRKSTKGRYRALVDAWAAVFGAANIIVRPYEAAQNQPSLVADLLIAIGFPALAAGIGNGVGQYNTSLGERDLAVIDALQHTSMDHELRRRIVKAIVRTRSEATGGALVSPALQLRLVEDNLEDYRHIARTYMGREDGVLFRDPLPDPAAAWQPPAPASVGEIVERVTAAMAPAKRSWRTRLAGLMASVAGDRA